MLTRTVAPASFITLPTAKSRLRVVHNEDDAMIEQMIASAIEYLDGPNGYTGQAIGDQEWRWKTGFFTTPLRLPIGPILSVDAVRYIDVDGVERTVAGSAFYTHFDPQGYYLKPVEQWPATFARDDAVTVEFTAGMGVIPAGLISAALILVSHLYTHREVQVDTETFPSGFSFWDLAAPYRRVF